MQYLSTYFISRLTLPINNMLNAVLLKVIITRGLWILDEAERLAQDVAAHGGRRLSCTGAVPPSQLLATKQSATYTTAA